MSDMYHPTADRLEAFVEGALQDGDRVIIESHLLSCPRCHTEVEEWRALFVALASLPQFEPRAGFADRVMTGVRIAPQPAWQRFAARAAAALSGIIPQSNFGWGLAAAVFSLPVLAGGALLAWVMQQSALTPRSLFAVAGDWLVQGMQGVGDTAITAVVKSDVMVWVLARASDIVNAGGMGALRTAFAVAGISVVLSIYVLYRNLVRTPSRDSNYGTLCF